MKTAVVILNWNGSGLLSRFLPSVIAHSPEADIWLADNASTDDSVAMARARFPELKIVENTANLGFAGGYNAALKQIDAEIYVLLNSDVEVTENWLQAPLRLFAQDSRTAIAQPKIRDYKDKHSFEYAGAAGGYIDRYGYPFCRGRMFGTVEKDRGQYEDGAEIFWASGACFFIRSKVFWELDGFDADFFAHQEEIDLCWRAFNAGHIAKYTPDSTVFHVGGATLSESSPKKTLLNFRNSLFLLHKNLPARDLPVVLLTRMLLDGLAGFRFLVQGKPRHFLAILHAHFGFYKMFRIMHLKRGKIQKIDYFKLKSVAFEYFVRGKKTFDSLF